MAQKEDRVVQFKWGDAVFSEVIEGNITLAEMSPDDISDALNRAVGNFAFYGSLRADAKKMLAKVNTDSEMWMAMTIQSMLKKSENAKINTDKAKVQKVMLENSKEWLNWEHKKRSVQVVVDKAYVLVQSFELMTHTLQSVLAFRRKELDSIGNSGNPNPVVSGVGDYLEELEVDNSSSNTRMHKEK